MKKKKQSPSSERGPWYTLLCCYHWHADNTFEILNGLFPFFFFFFYIKADKWFFEFTRNCGSAFYTWLKYVHSILCSPIYIILLTQRFLGARASQHRHGSMYRYCTVMRPPPRHRSGFCDENPLDWACVRNTFYWRWNLSATLLLDTVPKSRSKNYRTVVKLKKNNSASVFPFSYYIIIVFVVQ